MLLPPMPDPNLAKVQKSGPLGTVGALGSFVAARGRSGADGVLSRCGSPSPAATMPLWQTNAVASWMTAKRTVLKRDIGVKDFTIGGYGMNCPERARTIVGIAAVDKAVEIVVRAEVRRISRLAGAARASESRRLNSQFDRRLNRRRSTPMLTAITASVVAGAGPPHRPKGSRSRDCPSSRPVRFTNVLVSRSYAAVRNRPGAARSPWR